MGEWFLTSFAADPAGWISLFVAVAVVVFSAVFWRRTWAVIRSIGRALRSVWNGLRRIRITTVDNLKPELPRVFPPVRWIVGPERGQRPGSYLLFNAGSGSLARNVKLDSWSDDAQIASSAAWSEIPGDRGGQFQLRTRDSAFWIGVTFHVEWIDENGKAQAHTWIERGD